MMEPPSDYVARYVKKSMRMAHVARHRDVDCDIYSYGDSDI